MNDKLEDISLIQKLYNQVPKFYMHDVKNILSF